MKNKQKGRTLWSGLIFLGVLLLLSAVYLLYAKMNVSQKRERASAIAASETSAIQDRLNLIFSRDYAMNDVILSHEGSLEWFDQVGNVIYDEAEILSGIPLKNVAIAPGGIVQSVYPLAGNESLIGFDFMDESREGNAEAVEAYKKGSMVVTNPFTLVQGGMGMGARLPVYLKNGDKSSFWGLVTITLDYDKLIEAFRFETLPQRGYLYHLWYQEGDTAITLAQSSILPKNPVDCEFSMSNLRWHLSLAPASGWLPQFELAFAALTILGLSVLLTVLHNDQMNLNAANRELERLAQRDALCGCYSRQYVNMMLVDQQSGKWTDPDAKFSVALVDLDNFKHINDSFGHDVGDEALAETARLLQCTCKRENGDCVIRHGGDEFVVLYHDLTRERFELKLKQIVELIRGAILVDTPDLHLTVSVGGAWYDGSETMYYKQIHNADIKLYEAKEAGRNCYRL